MNPVLPFSRGVIPFAENGSKLQHHPRHPLLKSRIREVVGTVLDLAGHG